MQKSWATGNEAPARLQTIFKLQTICKLITGHHWVLVPSCHTHLSHLLNSDILSLVVWGYCPYSSAGHIWSKSTHSLLVCHVAAGSSSSTLHGSVTTQSSEIYKLHHFISLSTLGRVISRRHHQCGENTGKIHEQKWWFHGYEYLKNVKINYHL